MLRTLARGARASRTYGWWVNEGVGVRSEGTIVPLGLRA